MEVITDEDVAEAKRECDELQAENKLLHLMTRYEWKCVIDPYDAKNPPLVQFVLGLGGGLAPWQTEMNALFCNKALAPSVVDYLLEHHVAELMSLLRVSKESLR